MSLVSLPFQDNFKWIEWGVWQTLLNQWWLEALDEPTSIDASQSSTPIHPLNCQQNRHPKRLQDVASSIYVHIYRTAFHCFPKLFTSTFGYVHPPQS